MHPISIFNLNIMHGRNSKSAVFPPIKSKKKIENNLKNIADFIRQQNADIVTLQEIDEGSVFSGSFNQFDFFREQLKYSYAYFAPSCQMRFFGKNIFVTGNAIFSKYPLENCQSFKFNISFPTDRMGFVVADTKLPTEQKITVSSIHVVYLDWTRIHSRANQMRMIEKVLKTREKKFILGGDFNCEFNGKEKSLRDFVKNMDLQSYMNTQKIDSLCTYPSWQPKQRIDWVFSSKNVNLISYENIKDRLSDHLAILAHFSI